MAVLRVEKNKNYTTMSNYHLRDGRLTLKAKGLLSLMLSLPDNWTYTIEGLVEMVTEGESAVKSALKELKDNGYLKIEKKSGKGGRFEYEYVVFEQPESADSPEGDFPAVDEPAVDEPEVENHPVYKILNNKILKKEYTTYTPKKETKKRFVPPTVEEIRDYCKQRNNNVDAQRVYDFYNASEWKDSRGKPVLNWKQKIIGVWEKEIPESKEKSPNTKKVPDFTNPWNQEIEPHVKIKLEDLPF